MINWGCPDWRDATAYPSSPDELADVQWRWAFLRRLPKYRNLWEMHRKNRTDHDNPFIYWSGESQIRFAYEFGLNGLIDPEIPEEGSGFEFHHFAGHVRPLFKWWEEADVPESEVENDILESCKLDVMLQDSGIYHVSFDITKPLKPQLKRAERSLEYTQETFMKRVPQFKKRRDEWVRHLRIIDAKDQAATHETFFAHWAEEETGGDVDEMDQYYRDHKNPKATVGQWHQQAIVVMEKASRLL